MNSLAILQARVSSSRLPGKVLLSLLGEPMLFRQIERIGRADLITKLIVATSTDESDDDLVAQCARRGTPCVRGSLTDVLDRFVQAALPYDPETVIRLTGDCPLADPHLIDAMLREFEKGDYDYLTNGNPPTFPDGLDIEIMRFSCLLEAHREAKLPSEREHVTPFLRAHPERFRLGNFVSPIDRSVLRWTVDEPDDLEFIRSVYERLYPAKADFTTADVLELLAREPRLQLLNSRFERNEGYKKSLQEDARFLMRRK